MSRSRRSECPSEQGSLFDDPLPASATAGEEGCSAEDNLLERATSPEVVARGISRVNSNYGSAGIDGMTVEQLGVFWSAHGKRIRQVLLEWGYVPRPVRRVTVPKPGGGERLLGIPTVVDRVVQRMLLMALEPLSEPNFSESSYGFRPGRSQHTAVRKAKEYVASGLECMADIDLEKFFDRVNHDVLMARLARPITVSVCLSWYFAV